MRKFFITASLLFIFQNFSLIFSQSKKTEREYYQVTVYHFKTADQQQVIDNYLETAYLPALHRKGISQAGVFTPLANDTSIDKKLYIILPVKSLQQAADLPTTLLKDTAFQRTGKTYMDAVYSNPPYTRIETILAYAFPLAPLMNLPALSGPKQDRIYEFRSYESATEKLYYNKLQMFNDGGEVALFKRLNFNAIFYAGVIAGANMPNLIYLTSFENMTERDAHWKTFSADPAWKKLSSDPVYQKNVSKADIILMKAAAYSDY